MSKFAENPILSMQKIKPANPKGLRDFLPFENKNREYIIDILKHTFESFGYDSIYIPSFEKYETLNGKYGEEGDKLFFKILNSGNYLDKESLVAQIAAGEDTTKITAQISEKGLRYDHTVPLARFVSQHQNELTFPFKRYVIGPVWRADRPQAGRYQEFFQCDIDVLGNPSLLSEVEIIQIADQVYEKLNLNVDILINSKSLFQGICELFGMDEHRQKIATLIDKWDKIGREKLEEEFYKIAAFEPKKVKDFLDFLDNDKALEELETSNENLKKGLEEIAYIQKYAKSKNVKVSNKLVRGLDYYTGIVFEVVSTEMAYGSISGGGRYDNLTEIFGLKNMSGVGFSFGLDRIYDIMLKLGKFPESTAQDRILILNMEDLAMEKNMEIAKALRTMGLQASVYPSRAKMDKQLSYADKSKIDFAIIIGDQELAQNQVTIKNLKERFQATIDFSQIENYFKK